MTPKCYRACLRCAIMVGCCLLGVMASHLFAETPTQALQETIGRFQTLLHDPGLRDDRRTEQVLEAILARFDVQEMSKRILGPHWDQPREQQDAFVAEFTGFMKRMLLGHIDRIKSLQVTCQGEEIRGMTARVRANLATAGTAFAMSFGMRQQGSEWKIYDVAMDNGRFSFVSNYKTQLQWMLQSASFEQLLRLIRGKNS